MTNSQIYDAIIRLERSRGRYQQYIDLNPWMSVRTANMLQLKIDELEERILMIDHLFEKIEIKDT